MDSRTLKSIILSIVFWNVALLWEKDRSYNVVNWIPGEKIEFFLQDIGKNRRVLFHWQVSYAVWKQHSPAFAFWLHLTFTSA